MNEKNEDYDTLVLSGGGIKGFYLLGAIQALIDTNKMNKIKTFVGTSIGSIICYLIIIGYTPIEIVVSLYQNKWLENVGQINLLNMVNGFGATSYTFINEALEKMTISKIGKFITLKQLTDMFNKTLICVTYNMTTCVTEYLNVEIYPDMPCLVALRLSANLPIVFDRFKYMDCFYIDGGISDNFPILKGEEMGTKVIGLLLDINEKNLQDEPSEGILNYFTKLLQIPMTQSIKHKISQTTSKSSIIRIKTILSSNVIDFNVKSRMKLEMFSEGYISVKNFFNIL